MKIRYYFDENIADAIAKGLRRRGIDMLTLTEAGKLGADDEEKAANRSGISISNGPGRSFFIARVEL